MGNLLPGETLIYERVNHQIYARYANKPEIPRWVIGEYNGAPNDKTIRDLKDLLELSKTNNTLKKELDKLLNLYYIIKDSK